MDVLKDATQPNKRIKLTTFSPSRKLVFSMTDIEAISHQLAEVIQGQDADYIEALWDRPPCEEARHERFFGLVRPDGSLKPHAEVIRRFAATKPMVKDAERTVDLGVTTDGYYDAPWDNLGRLYRDYVARYEG